MKQKRRSFKLDSVTHFTYDSFITIRIKSFIPGM